MATGSLINMIAQASRSAKPEVGMGATRICWSDRHAFTVIEVKSPTTIVLQRDKAIRTDSLGMSDAQSYRYERDESGEIEVATLRKNGRWVSRGSSMSDGLIFSLGARDEYYDFSF